MSRRRNQQRLPPRPSRKDSSSAASRPRSRWRWLAAAGLLIIAALFSVQFSRGKPPPVIAVDTTGFDPIIAAAIAEAQHAARIAPRSATARGRMGMVLLAHDVRAEARHCFTQAMAMAPHEPRWPYFLGLAQVVDDRPAAAANLDLAVRLFPERESAPRLKLADTLLALGRIEEAEAHYRHVWRQHTHSAPASLGLGKIATARDQLPEAAEFLSAASNDLSTRAAAHRLLLNVNRKLGRAGQAERMAQLLAELPDDEPWPDPYLAEVELLKTGEQSWLDLGDKWINAGRAAEAVPLLARAVETYPGSDRALFLLGRARLRLGDATGAEAILMRAVELAPDSVEAQMQLGVTRLALGRAQAAQPCFRAAIQTKPNLAEAWFNLGLTLGNAGDRSECVAAFREAIRLKPDLSEAYLGLAVALRANGEKALAAQELRRALDLDPPEPLRQKLLDQLKRVELP